MFDFLSKKSLPTIGRITLTLATFLLLFSYLPGCNEEDESVTGACSDPPTMPINPSPAHTSDSISIYTNISWEGGNSQCNGLTPSYNVYFGTDRIPNADELKGNTGSKSWDLDTLQYKTKYYWWIVAKDGNGTSSGYVWWFKTEPEPVE